MQLPLRITFRHMERSPEIESLVWDRARDLKRFAKDIVGCRVVVEPASGHHERGNLYDIKIDVTVPDSEITVSRSPGERHEHKDIHVALRDAFDAVCRQLEDIVRRRRHDTKVHDAPSHGRISQVFPIT